MAESSISSVLQKRLTEAANTSARLQGVYDSESATLVATKKKVGEAKGRQELNKEVVTVIEALQQRLLGRSVGVFENVLSAILRDVLPEEGSVRLVPEYKNNTTSLEILLQKNNGRLEDILEGNGGAVTNVLSTGLRFATLARTKNRALLVLDEPDCWLKPTRVPAFLKVIAEVSKQGFQTFFVTHHDVSVVEGQVNIVELARDESTNVIQANLLPPIVREWASDDEPGIRKIEIFGFCSHEHTVIPCFPGATAFVGENNVGKSAGMSGALRAVAYGISSDAQINHDCDSARLVYHLEKNKRIEWVRFRNKSPAVIYRLYEGDNPQPVKESGQPARNKAPDWVVELLGITRVDELDIQLKSQKSPVFLLDESGPRQAKLLAIGKESSYLDVLMARYEELKTADRQTVTNGEAEVIRISNRLKAFDAFPLVLDTIASLYFDIDSIVEVVDAMVALLNLIESLPELEAAEALDAKRVALLPILPAVPVLMDTSELERLIKDVEQHEAWATAEIPALPALPILDDLTHLEALIDEIEHHALIVNAGVPPELPALPELTPVDELAKTGAELAQLEKEVAYWEQVTHVPPLPLIPELQDLTALETDAVQLSRLLEEEKAAADSVHVAQADLDEVTAEYEALAAELGGVCPLCSNALGDIHTHEA